MLRGSTSRYHTGVHILAALGLGLTLGLLSQLLSFGWVLIGLLGAYFALAIAKRPEVGLLAIVALLSTVVPSGTLPYLSFGVASLHISDLILLALFGILMARLLVERDFGFVHTPLDAPLLTFYGIAVLSTVLAMSGDSLGYSAGVRALRPVTFYLTLFLVTNLLRERRQLVLLVEGMLALGTLVAVLMIAQFLVGQGVTLIPGRVETLYNSGTSYTGVLRLLPPGQSLVLLSFIVAATELLRKRVGSGDRWRVLQAGLLGIAVILTFNRSFWAVTIMALGLLVFLLGGRARIRLAGWGLGSVALVGLALLLLPPAAAERASTFITAAGERLASLISTSTLEESSLQHRYVEYPYALEQIASHPVLGLGLGARYRPWDSRIDWAEFDGRAYIHNGHLWIMLETGLLGYLAFLALSLIFIARGLRHWRQVRDHRQRGWLLSFTLLMLGLLFANMVSPIYRQYYWPPLIGIMMGVGEVVLRGAGQDARAPGGGTIDG